MELFPTITLHSLSANKNISYEVIKNDDDAVLVTELSILGKDVFWSRRKSLTF